ncbi:MAG TPA: Xaa-Pro peptidase family protein [Actinomycetota bacterium]|nr:Xaa-Pro peptidase family protein [Actinomycetota bacterium]
MTTFLLYDDALRSPELRHEISEPVMDPMVFIEHDDRRVLIGSVLEAPIFDDRPEIVDEFWLQDSLGSEDLIKDASFPVDLVDLEVARRALERLGARTVVVPPTFRVKAADYLRERGVEVVVDAEAWMLRRRRKSPAELEGIERAQRATETAMLAAQRMLREAEPTSDGRLRFEGEILTAEWIRQVMQQELGTQGAECEDIIVHSGDACLNGHDIGSGPILPDQTVIIDCFPKDRRSGAYTDMTRTFVPGEPSEEIKRIHADCCRALEIAYEHLEPGRDDAHRAVVDFFHERGYPTREHHEGDEPLGVGFFHSLGHGVGLEVHERPWVGRRPDALADGDVVAIEPGLYFPGVGGVRLEDTVVVTDDGPHRFTDPFPYDLEV